MGVAGLQRGRLVGLVRKGVDLISADQVAQQISLDDAGGAWLLAEEAVDRIRTNSALTSWALLPSSGVPHDAISLCCAVAMSVPRHRARHRPGQPQQPRTSPDYTSEVVR
ncbi:hypothetical protein [Streptomyces sp. NPDC004533]|uniref:hypothetical protein n=1 Tax=Streptomyces sp. NPDC004533 TaxID=3154278 RepID=UPI0033A041EE